jgi:hypothetical protein
LRTLRVVEAGMIGTVEDELAEDEEDDEEAGVEEEDEADAAVDEVENEEDWMLEEYEPG